MLLSVLLTSCGCISDLVLSKTANQDVFQVLFFFFTKKVTPNMGVFPSANVPQVSIFPQATIFPQESNFACFDTKYFDAI